VKALPTVEDIWRAGLGYAPPQTTDNVVGDDKLEGGEDEALPSATSANGASEESDDDLI